MPLGVVTSGTPAWTTSFRDATRNPLEPGTGQLDLADAPTFAFRWKTAPPGPTQFGDDQDVALAGTMLYTTGWDGTLKAFDTTGSQANRPPIWAVVPAPGTGAGYTGAPSISGTRILVFDTDRRLHAVSTTDGSDLWHTDQLSGPADAPLVVGSAVYVRDSAYQVRAFSVSDGAPLWAGQASAPPNVYGPLSSDGTRIFGVSGCDLVAINAATGAVAWQVPIRLAPANECASALSFPPPPIVVAGKVYAAEPAGRAVVDAATGTVDLRFDAPAFGAGTGVVVGGLWLFPTDNRVVAVDVLNGELVWRSEDGISDGLRLSSTGDLLIAATPFGVTGLSRLTGESVFEGGTLQGVGGTPAIGTNRFFLTAQDGTRAYGPL
jgi:outer membrane protein assembly factor BamB